MQIEHESLADIEESISIASQKMRNDHRVQVLMVCVGMVLLILSVALIYSNVPIEGLKGIWLSAVVSIGVAALTAGIAGSLTVEYRGAGLVASGSLGLAAFLIVFAACVHRIW